MCCFTNPYVNRTYRVKIKWSLPISVRSNSRVTAGATNGSIRANPEAKITARMQHDIAYTGSYTPGYTAIKNRFDQNKGIHLITHALHRRSKKIRKEDQAVGKPNAQK